MTKASVKNLNDQAWARWTALGLLAFAMFCSYIFMDVLSPIKDLLQSTRGWDSTAFGTMQGSETFLNVFIFFLIFAGIILDKMGVRFTAVLSGAVMLVGATINWYALTDAFIGSSLDVWFTTHLNYIPVFDELGISPFYEGMPASAKFSAVGFMIFGCGVEMAGITVSRGIVKWFKGREMALAMGSEMALARLGVATCMIFSPMFAELGGVVSVSRSVALWTRSSTSRPIWPRRRTIPSSSRISGKYFRAAVSGLWRCCVCFIIRPFSPSRSMLSICCSAT